MGSRRRLAGSSGGPNWSGIAVAVGTLLAGVAAAVGVMSQMDTDGPTPTIPSASVAQGPSAPLSAGGSAGASADSLLVRSVDALPRAMVRIVATGTFAPPPGAGQDDVGHGSGFLVDPSGIIVTNSHVVTGAETVAVWVGNELTKENAEVLGVSECFDLAVIKLQGRNDLPYLDWYDGRIESGIPIHAAGYPLGSTKAKVTTGAVVGALGPTDAARLSVDDAIELDANIPAGSSGGPVVNDQGQVLGINYPKYAQGQPFAIGGDEARHALDVLQGRSDVKSLGINGYAQTSDPAGIWVASVKPGSPAAGAKILPGDVVTELDGKSMAVRGTMAEYCDSLSDYQEGDPLSFTVYRNTSGETFKGNLTGDPIAPDFAFVVDVAGAAPTLPQSWAKRTTKLKGSLSVETSPEWSGRKEWVWVLDGKRAGPGFFVAPNVSSFRGGYSAPGAYVGASAILAETTTPDDILNGKRPGLEAVDCKLDSRAEFTRGGYIGVYDLWTGCGRETSQFFTIAAKKADRSHIIYIQFQAPDPADLAVLDRILVTLEFTPEG